MESIRDRALRAFAEARGVGPEALDLDDPIDDEDDDAVVAALCDRAGLEPSTLFPPPPGLRRSELAVAGLRRLAPVSPRAAARLAEMPLRWEVTTIGSFVRSLEEGRWVGSGRWEETSDPPIPPGRSATAALAWTLLPGAALTLSLWAGCNPACRACPTLAETLPWGLGPSAVAVAAWHAAMLAAAFREMRGSPVAVATP